MATKHFCDICKKEFDKFDESSALSISAFPGYGSRFDGENVHFDLCCNCFDNLILHVMLPSCKANALTIEPELECADKAKFDYSVMCDAHA